MSSAIPMQCCTATELSCQLEGAGQKWVRNIPVRSCKWISQRSAIWTAERDEDMIEEPITRSLQLSHILVTAFSQTDLFQFEFISNSDPTGTSVTNYNHKHGLMLICWHVHVRPHCFILTEACSCRLELACFSREKYLKGLLWELQAPSNGLLTYILRSLRKSHKT